MPPETHQQVYLKAKQAGASLNEWPNRAIERQLEE
jgi:predicted HicB family RNase H-like nuclease